MFPAGDTKVLDTTGMVLVPDSTFMMGSNENSNEQPRHEVRVHGFWLDRHGVTNPDYIAFLKYQAVLAGKDPSRVTPPSPNGFDDPDQPVVNVSWDDADRYCRWKGKRLPTEAEREKAAIGPSKGYDPKVQYATSDGQWHPDEVVWNTNSTANVCSKGEKGYGFCDLSGEVWEWVADWYDADYYKRSPQEDPQGPERGETKVLRGGSWNNHYGGGDLRAAVRGGDNPGSRGNDVGFRCAASSEDPPKKLK